MAILRTASLRTIGLAALLAAVAALLIASFVAYQDWERYQVVSKASDETRRILALNETLINRMRDAETGQRGFLLTSRPEYLDSYNAVLERAPAELRELNALVASGADPSGRFRELGSLIDAKLDELGETIELRRTAGAEAALAVVKTNRGKRTMDRIRIVSQDIEQVENDRWLASWNDLKTGAERTRVAMLMAGLVLVALVGGGAIALKRAGGQMERLISQLDESKRDTEAMLGATLYSIGDAVIATDREGGVQMMNAVAEQLTGYTEKEARLQNIERIFHIVNETTRSAVENPVWRVLREERAVDLANHSILISKDGRQFPIEDSGAPIVGRSGAVSGVVLVFRDASERKQAVEASQRSAAIVESSNDAIFGETLEGIVTSWNRGATRLYGYTAQEMIGKTIAVLVPVEQGNELEQIRQRILGGESLEHYETPRLTKDGRRITISLTASPIRNDEGHIVGFAKIGRDISRERQLEESIRQAQKMEAVGRLAGGIAHDFNNLLTVILGYSTLLENRLAPEDPLRATVAQILRAAGQAASLTAQLLAFSRKQITQPRLLDLNGLVQETQEMLRRLIGEDIDLAVILEGAACAVKADPGQITQVLMNLAVNARDAMATGGKLTIETHIAERQHEDLGHRGIRPAGRYVTLSVSDTGTGMDLKTQASIFEPFFTTKESGKGTGLGLATVFGIVQQHGGWIDVYSECNQGSTFHVYLPAADKSAVETVTVAERPAPRGSATILLVEDQAALRTLARDVLSEAGHLVLTAHNGRVGLQVASEFKDKIDLLVTDVVMPEMSGPELAAEVSRLRPGLIVLYMSGYTDHALLHRGVLEQGTAFLQKPFLPQSLLVKVDDLLRAAVASER
jgi:two-component system cell cycle sensor histidine kinase/response regulator CckA